MTGTGRKRRWRAAALVLLGAVVAHALSIALLPAWVGHVAMARATEVAGGHNVLLRVPPVTPDDRTIRRPSPDLLYSVCVVDAGRGPVEVEMAPTPGYASVSVYDTRLDNILTRSNASRRDRPIRVTFGAAGDAGDPDLAAPEKFIVLLRHLRPAAPGRHADRSRDVCRSVSSAR